MAQTQPTTTSRNVHIRYYADACERLNIPYSLSVRTRRLSLTTKSGKKVYCYKASTPLNFQASVTLSKDKFELHQALEPSGLPLPDQERIKNSDELRNFFSRHQKIVVKPADSHGGRGVTVLPSQEELESAWERARKESRIVIAEQYVAGKNYRFLVLNDKVLAIAFRQPPTIKGDGITNLETLFTDLNAENKAQGLPKIPDTPYTWKIVKDQGYSRDSIPPAGSEILLRLTANLSLGGTVQDVTDLCHPSYKQLAIEATKQLGLTFAGIDIIAEDISTPNKPAFIIEANAAPGLRIHYKSTNGKTADVAMQVISAIMEL